MAALALLALCANACGTASDGGTTPTIPPDPPPPPDQRSVVIDEVVSKNQGNFIDEQGETDDWIELANVSNSPVGLAGLWLEDSSGARAELPVLRLDPGRAVVLWADDDVEQGARHLPFKLSSSGDHLWLRDADGRLLDEVELPALPENVALARFPSGGELQTCRYASPGASNGSQCAPPAPPTLLDDTNFQSFELPEHHPARSGLSMVELSLRPATGDEAFIELLNEGSAPLDLGNYAASLSTHAPNLPWPAPGAGAALSLPDQVIEVGERVVVPVAGASLSELASSDWEGVVTLYEGDSLSVVHRVDFMSWPEASVLARPDPQADRLSYCENPTPGTRASCQPVASREVGERVRHLRTPGDYAALAEGATQVGIRSVKFVVDLEAPGLVHLLSSARWPLHYTFVRERIYLQPELDRCDPEENAEFYQGWSDFSYDEYFRVEGRRFLLGTLSHHGGADLHAVEYTYGDAISGPQMRDGFLAVAPHLDAPGDWVLRPQDDNQVRKVRTVEGSVPLVGPNAPFENVTYQPLTEGVTYGTLRFIPAEELGSASLGPEIIVITDDVPNDIAFVGGLVTEAFQTPLAHVNVLSQNRGTPNASLKSARTELAAWLDQLVRLEVTKTGLVVSAADLDEAQAHFERFQSDDPPVSPRLDTTLRGVQALSDHDLGSLPAIGAKAAQLAQLSQGLLPYCGSTATPIETPANAFAIPVVHFVEHFEASGARARLVELMDDAAAVLDPTQRSQALSEVRALIEQHAVDAALLSEVEAAVESRFGDARVRFRSSSNTEDLPGFNGAGLYTSVSAKLSDPDRGVADALRTVWASLYNTRAFDERRHARIDDSAVAMGVMVHEAFLSERDNGVAVSRNVLDPSRGDIYYVNAQAGEASVTNPAPGITTEQMVYRWYREPPIIYQSESSLHSLMTGAGAQVLSATEVEDLSCALRSVHDLFHPLLDPESENRHFAMEVEFKHLGPQRRLLLKQARPHSFAEPASFADCREL